MLTSGFFNSSNSDRLYDAEQMSSIFDGVIADGVYETVGNKFRVKPGDGMEVFVDTGRAWFNHTWTVNSTQYPLQIDRSESSYNRIDLVVLEVDHSEEVRANSLKVVTGLPAINPVKPTLVNTDFTHQYPLAQIYVKAGVTGIATSAITNLVGTSSCPFVTGVVEVMSIDQFVSQWGAEFTEWMDANESEFRAWYSPFVTASENQFDTWYDEFTTNSENEFNTWSNTQKTALTTWISQHEEEFSTWSEAQKTALTTWISEHEEEFSTWSEEQTTAVMSWISEHEEEFDTWSTGKKADFDEWFSNLVYVLDGDVAGHLQNEIDAFRPLTDSEIDETWNTVFGS